MGPFRKRGNAALRRAAEWVQQERLGCAGAWALLRQKLGRVCLRPRGLDLM